MCQLLQYKQFSHNLPLIIGKKYNFASFEYILLFFESFIFKFKFKPVCFYIKARDVLFGFLDLLTRRAKFFTYELIEIPKNVKRYLPIKIEIFEFQIFPFFFYLQVFVRIHLLYVTEY